MESSGNSPRMTRFGVFEVDLHAGELRKQGVKVKLQEQPFQVLAYLLARSGEVVTREELRQTLWPADTFVDFDHSLSTSINKIREALGDSATNPRFVETVHRRGYRFIAPVEGAPPSLPETTPTRRRTVVGATLIVAAFALVGLLAWSIRPEAPIESLAVLPLANISGDPEQEYLSLGMTDALIGELTRIDALRVPSRTSLMRYKERTDKSLSEIARELEVDAVVDGSVLQVGDRIRIAVQLVHAETDTNLWGESYERDTREVLVLQGEVARAIAEAVQVKLAPQQEARFTTTREVDPEVWKAHLRGRYVLNTKFDPDKSISYFEQALEKDPDYAPAHAGLASAYWNSAWGWGLADPRVAVPKARAASERALELDDRVYTPLAGILGSYYWDWSGSEREYKRRIEVEPNPAASHRGYAFFLGTLGRHDEAWAELKRAQELQPRSSPGSTDELVRTLQAMGMQYCLEGRYEEAIRQFHEILEMKPTPNVYLQFWLGHAYARQGEYQEAILAFQPSAAMRRAWGGKAALAYTHALAGNTAEALRTLDEFNELSKERYVPPSAKAVIWAGLGDNDRAFQWLERACDEHDLSMAFLKVHPIYESLRPDPRFQALLKRMNFPE